MRTKTHELWEHVKGNAVGWAVEEKPEIWHTQNFRPEKTQKSQESSFCTANRVSRYATFTAGYNTVKHF